MFQPLFAALVAICCVLLVGDSAVGATVCEEKDKCVVEYKSLEQSLDNANSNLSYVYLDFFNKIHFDDTPLKRKVMKYLKELENGCDFVPLNKMPCRFPYQAAAWYGYIYENFFFIFGTQYMEDLPELKLVPADCAKSLEICQKSYKNITDYIARKRDLMEQIERVNDNLITETLTVQVEELERKIKNRTHCAQNSCRAVQACTEEYQRKQEKLESIYIGRYLKLAEHYERQGNQMNLKDQLSLLIKQNFSSHSHCAVRPSSRRVFPSPYDAAFQYGTKYNHVAPSGCTLANRNLPPIPGSTSCAVMEKTCNEYLVKADKTIEEQEKAVDDLTKLIYNVVLTSEKSVLKETIENLGKDVKAKFISHPCTKCDRVEACHTQYLKLQADLNDVNQKIHTVYMKKFERDDIENVFKEKIRRMKLKIEKPCNVVPVSEFDYTFSGNRCYWRGYSYGIALLQATHSLTPYFEQLPALTVHDDCATMAAECYEQLRCGNELLTKKQKEFDKIRIEDEHRGLDIPEVIAEYRKVQAKYNSMKHLTCYPHYGDEKCAAELQECKSAYNASQGKLDAARTRYFNEFVEYYEISGMLTKYESSLASLDEQIRKKCELIPEHPSKIYGPPYYAPYEHTEEYGLKQLDIFYVHGASGDQVIDCEILLSQCKKLLDTANYRINGTKTMANYFAALNPPRNVRFINLEVEKIKKEWTLVATISKNDYCRRVTEGNTIINYFTKIK